MQAQLITHNNKKGIFLLGQKKFIEITEEQLFFKPAKKLTTQDHTPQIISPLTGKIIKLFVTEDQIINSGQTVVTIESMKMENEIRAPSNAVIQTIHIAPNSMVQKNQVLITLTPITSAL